MTPREKERSGLRYTKAESDQLAEQNLDPELIPIWRRSRHLFPYDREPDYRAEAFREYIHDDPNAVSDYWLGVEDDLTPEHFERAERASWEAKHGPLEEAVPF
jgi:hypothetical protein